MPDWYNACEVMMVEVKFTMVMDKDLANKLSYIGKYYGRSRIKEIEWACKLWVKEFEEKVDEISLEDAGI